MTPEPNQKELEQAEQVVLGTVAYAIATRGLKALKIESVDRFKELYDELCSGSIDHLLESMKTRRGCIEHCAKLLVLREAGMEFFLHSYTKLDEQERSRMVWALRWIKTGHIDALEGTVLMMDSPKLREAVLNPKNK